MRDLRKSSAHQQNKSMKNVPRGIAVLALASGLFGFSTFALAQDYGPQPIVSCATSATVEYGNDAVFSPAKRSMGRRVTW